MQELQKLPDLRGFKIPGAEAHISRNSLLLQRLLKLLRPAGIRPEQNHHIPVQYRPLQRYVRCIGTTVVIPQIHYLLIFNINRTGNHLVQHILVVKSINHLPVLLCLLIKEQCFIDILFYERIRRCHGMPDLQNFIQRCINIQKHLREA